MAASQEYERVSDVDHVRLRPDSYVGPVGMVTERRWLHDGQRLLAREATFNPGLLKIVDEVAVNAADNLSRSGLDGAPAMTYLRLTVDAGKGTIAVENNGRHITTADHAVEGCPVPQLLFGALRSGSNFKDGEKRVTGGRNGVGAAIANIMSSSFTVEIRDPELQRVYSQTWTNGMKEVGPPRVVRDKAKSGYTRITFAPDLPYFGMTELDADAVALLRKRAYDLAATLGKGVKVTFNDEHVLGRPAPPAEDGPAVDKARRAPVPKPFEAYCRMRAGEAPYYYDRVNARWELFVAASEDGRFGHMSFVNHIATAAGGTHVDHVVTQLVTGVFEAMVRGKALEKMEDKEKRRYKDHIKAQLFVGVSAMVEDPSFDSQSKDRLNTRATAFGSKCTLGDAAVAAIMRKAGLRARVEAALAGKDAAAAKKTDGSKSGRPRCKKLKDASQAGTRNSGKCSLILTEGDSATALAMAGLAVVGCVNWGILTLGGVPLNASKATQDKINKNEEITELKAALGLRAGVEYKDASALRYGSLVIMTDADHDGAHITGLIIANLRKLHPSVLAIPGFLRRFVTPIIKARRGAQTEAFFTSQARSAPFVAADATSAPCSLLQNPDPDYGETHFQLIIIKKTFFVKTFFLLNKISLRAKTRPPLLSVHLSGCLL